jgi:hypothetical protein
MQLPLLPTSAPADHSRHLSRALFLFLMVLLTTVDLAAQTYSSASLQGDITATDRTGIPGAHVELLYVPTGALYRVAARDDGHYVISGLRPGGPYALTISHVGFATQKRTGLFLRSYESQRLDILLRQVNLAAEEVVVTGKRQNDALERMSSGASLRIDKEQMDALPRASGTLEDAQRLSPYMVGQSALGLNRMYNDVSLDGIGIGDQFGLQHAETLPGGMAASPVSMESIQEVRVDLSPFDVQRSGFTGASISAITRGGTNVFSGSVYGLGAGGWLVGRNPDDRRRDLRGFLDDRAGFSIGGPIMASRAFYFVSAELSQVRLPIERRFGALTTGGTQYSISPAAIDQFLTALDTLYSYDPGRMDIVSLQHRSANVFARFDLNLSRRQRLSLRYNLLANWSDRPPYETSVFAEGTLARNTNVVHSVVGSLNSVVGSSLTNELLIGFTRRKYTSTPVGTPFPFVDVIETDQQRWWNHLTAGSEIGGNGNNTLEHHLEIRNSASLTFGTHLLTGGIQGDVHWFKTRMLQDQWGKYTFDSRSAFMKGRPAEYEYRYARAPGTDLSARWHALQFAAFLQDELSISPTFSVTVGLRADIPVFPDKPQANPMVRDAFLPAGFDVATDRVPLPRVMVSPRIGFKWDAKADHSMQIRGGAGIFTGRIPYAWIDNLYSHTGMDYIHIKESAFAPKFVADPTAQPIPGPSNRLKETMEIVAISPGFLLPQEMRWTLALDLAFPGSITASLEAVISRTLDGVVFKNVNLKHVRTIKYTGPEIVTTETGDEREIVGKLDDRFTNAILMTNATVGTTSFYTLQIQRRPNGSGVFLNLAYSGGITQDMNSGMWDNAYDQWRYNPAIQPNEPALGFSALDRTHRLLAALSYQHEWSAGLMTTFGLVYTGTSGTPYSYVYDGDENGDGESLNDLFYVPAQYTEVHLYDDNGALEFYKGDYGPYNELFKFIAEDDYLKTRRGQLTERNGARTPWVHLVDLRIAQCLPLPGRNQVECSVEVLNVLNLLKPSWGQVKTVPNHVVPVLKAESPGAVGFRWAPRTSPLVPEPLLSRWRVRFGVRYSF